MRFFVDESFPKSVGEFLNQQGHVVIDVRQLGQSGVNDETVFRLAQEHEAVLLTTDRDFFHTIPHLHPNHFGIIVISLRQPNRQSIQDRLLWFLGQFPDADLDDHVVQLRDKSYLIVPKST